MQHKSIPGKFQNFFPDDFSFVFSWQSPFLFIYITSCDQRCSFDMDGGGKRLRNTIYLMVESADYILLQFLCLDLSIHLQPQQQIGMEVLRGGPNEWGGRPS
jgi:hypothetical protein